MNQLEIEGGDRMISCVYWTQSGRFAFQAIDRYWRVYDENGDFVAEFRNFHRMNSWIYEHDK